MNFVKNQKRLFGIEWYLKDSRKVLVKSLNVHAKFQEQRLEFLSDRRKIDRERTFVVSSSEFLGKRTLSNVMSPPQRNPAGIPCIYTGEECGSKTPTLFF